MARPRRGCRRDLRGCRDTEPPPMTMAERTRVSTRLAQVTLTEMQVALAVCAVAFVLFAACIPRITTRLDPVTGDEPFYLITAYSLLHDHDIDETNNFANH